jgi:hypothetical protein
MSDASTPLTVALNREQNDYETLIPGIYFGIATLPAIASDPTNPDRLILVYHDTPTSTSADVNVYLRVLKKSGDFWSAGAPVPVNNNSDPPNKHSDQFLPQVTMSVVSGMPRAHVTFYDDRRFTNAVEDQLDGGATPNPKFDVWYALASIAANDTVTIETNLELFLTTDGPALLDFNESPSAFLPYDRPGDYNGIAVDAAGNVLAVNTGTDETEPSSNNPSCIWFSEVNP